MSKPGIIDLNKQLIEKSKEAVSRMESLQTSVQTNLATLKKIEAELIKVVRAEAEEKRQLQIQEAEAQKAAEAATKAEEEAKEEAVARAAEEAKAEEAAKVMNEAIQKKEAAKQIVESEKEDKAVQKPSDEIKAVEKTDDASIAVKENKTEQAVQPEKVSIQKNEAEKIQVSNEQPVKDKPNSQVWQTVPQKQWQQQPQQYTDRKPDFRHDRFDNDQRPQGQQYQQRPQGQYQQRPEGQYQQKPEGQYQQRPEGQYQQRPEGQYQQRPQGQYQQRPEGQYQQRPEGQYQQRPQGQYQQRPEGQYQQRPQGQYQQRPQGQYQQRPQGQYQQGQQYQQRPQGGQQGPRPGGQPYSQRGPQRPGQRPMDHKPNSDEKMVSLESSGFVSVEKKVGQNKKHHEDTYRWDDKSKNPKKSVLKEHAVLDDEERYRVRKRFKAKPMIAPIVPVVIDKAIMNMNTISVKTLAERTGKPVADLLKKLLLLGMMCNINSELDYDTAQLICSEFGINLELKLDKTAEDALGEEDQTDREEDLHPRPPIVTVMGHVDHGKTSLLDAIRSAHVTEHEAGGITQHIGAYTIKHKDRVITFLDTPGHEAFTAMRARGAQVTDIAILVVAADDGVMPQTIEAINHAKAAKVPIIVAINKMDKPGANPSKVMQSLTEYGLLAEEWGGETVMVPVSAVTKEGIEHLLEMIGIVSDVQELKANPNRLAKGTIVEAKLDKGRGPVATVLVQNGTLHIQDMIVAGTAYGRVRAMTDDKGREVLEAFPSQPVEVVGFSEVPVAGDILHAVDQDKLTRQVAEERRDKQKAGMLKNLSKVSLDDLFSQVEDGKVKELNIIIKADVQGSVEAVKQALEKLSNDEVKVNVIHSGVGAIKAMDVMLATASNAIIIGFNVRPDSMARIEAEKEKVEMRLYRIIYKAIEDIELAMKGMRAPKFKEAVLGHAEVRSLFNVSTIGTIAGSYVTDGKIVKSAQVRLLRDNVVIHEGGLASLKRFKDDAREVNQGYECGITIKNFNDIKEGDIIESFDMQEIER